MKFRSRKNEIVFSGLIYCKFLIVTVHSFSLSFHNGSKEERKCTHLQTRSQYNYSHLCCHAFISLHFSEASFQGCKLSQMLLVTLSQGLHSLAGEGKGDGERHHREAGSLKFHQLTTEQANKRE